MLFLLAGCHVEANLRGLNKLSGRLTKPCKTQTESSLFVMDCRWCLDACLARSSHVNQHCSCENLKTREGQHDMKFSAHRSVLHRHSK